MASFQAFSSSLQLGLVAAHAFVALSDIGGVSDLDFLERGLLGGVVGGANFIRALERHVLEHVSQAGLSHGILRRTRIDHGKKGKDRSLSAVRK